MHYNRPPVVNVVILCHSVDKPSSEAIMFQLRQIMANTSEKDENNILQLNDIWKLINVKLLLQKYSKCAINKFKYVDTYMIYYFKR